MGLGLAIPAIGAGLNLLGVGGESGENDRANQLQQQYAGRMMTQGDRAEQQRQEMIALFLPLIMRQLGVNNPQMMQQMAQGYGNVPGSIYDKAQGRRKYV